MSIEVYMREPAVKVLGPGIRYALWVQGCSRGCEGCIAKASQKQGSGTRIDTGVLAMEIALSGAEGLTISGGEPFDQAGELAKMIDEIRLIRPMDVICFSGYLKEELEAEPEKKQLLERIDALIDGEYIESLNDNGAMRGSSNQRVFVYNPKLRKYFQENFGTGGRHMEIFFHGNEIHKVGIPMK